MNLNNFNPAKILCLQVFFILILYIIFGGDFYQFGLVAVLHVVIFCTVFYVAYNFFVRINSTSLFVVVKPFLDKRIIFFISFVFGFITFYKSGAVFGSAGVDSFMEFRSAISSDENELGGRVSIGVGLSFPLSLLSMCLASRGKNRVYYFLFLILSFLLAVLATSKIFIMLFLLYLFAFSNLNKKFAALIILMGFASFFGSHVLLEKFSSDPEQGLTTALFNTFQVYLLGGFSAYSKLVDGLAHLHPMTTFSSLYPYVSAFGQTSIPTSTVLPWVSIGRWYTNVYTAFGYWFALLGDLYAFIVPVILAAYYGIFFSKSNFANRNFVFYKVFLVFCIAFTFVGDHFIPAFLMHLIFIFLSFIYGAVKE